MLQILKVTLIIDIIKPELMESQAIVCFCLII